MNYLLPHFPQSIFASGIVYAFVESTIEGKLVLLVLFLGSIFSWSVMLTKIRMLHAAKKQSAEFTKHLSEYSKSFNLSSTHG